MTDLLCPCGGVAKHCLRVDDAHCCPADRACDCGCPGCYHVRRAKMASDRDAAIVDIEHFNRVHPDTPIDVAEWRQPIDAMLADADRAHRREPRARGAS